MAEGVATAISGRVFVDQVNNNKINHVYDFAYGDYIANQSFLDELSRIQSGLLLSGEVELSTGLVATMDSAGGLLALQLHMESLNAAKDAMVGLAKLGLKNEIKLWTLQ